MKGLRDAGDDIVLVDVGDAVQGAGDFSKIKADFYCKALPLLKYDAVALGETELRYILEHPDARLFGAVPVVCANALDSSGKPFVPDPYVIKRTASGLKVGIVGILSEQVIFSAIQRQTGITIASPEEALKKRVEKLRKKADVVILLSHAGGATKGLVEAVPGIDVALSGHSMGSLMDVPKKVGDAIYMETRQNSKFIGKLVLDIDANKKITGFIGEYVGMEKAIKSDPDIDKLVAEHDQQIAAYLASMRRDLTKVEPIPVSRDPKPFVGSGVCARCHADEQASWVKSGHAKAFEALTKDQSRDDPECLSCHTTGFKAKGGFVSARATPLLMGVQCEVCHGPGVAHSRNPKKGYGTVMEQTCLQCHNTVRSPKFEYKAYLSKISHRSAD